MRFLLSLAIVAATVSLSAYAADPTDAIQPAVYIQASFGGQTPRDLAAGVRLQYASHRASFTAATSSIEAESRAVEMMQQRSSIAEFEFNLRGNAVLSIGGLPMLARIPAAVMADGEQQEESWVGANWKTIGLSVVGVGAALALAGGGGGDDPTQTQGSSPQGDSNVCAVGGGSGGAGSEVPDVCVPGGG